MKVDQRTLDKTLREREREVQSGRESSSGQRRRNMCREQIGTTKLEGSQSAQG